MKATWTFHRFVRAESRWIDTPAADAEATPGLLVKTDHEVEATLSLDGAVTVRDTVWPLVWRLCLEPVRALVGDGQAAWPYRCFASRTTITLRADGDQVWVRRDQDPETAFPAAALWPALVAIGAQVVALAERDLGADARDIALLRPSLDRAQALLRERGWA